MKRLCGLVVSSFAAAALLSGCGDSQSRDEYARQQQRAADREEYRSLAGRLAEISADRCKSSGPAAQGDVYSAAEMFALKFEPGNKYTVLQAGGRVPLKEGVAVLRDLVANNVAVSPTLPSDAPAEAVFVGGKAPMLLVKKEGTLIGVSDIGSLMLGDAARLVQHIRNGRTAEKVDFPTGKVLAMRNPVTGEARYRTLAPEKEFETIKVDFCPPVPQN